MRTLYVKITPIVGDTTPWYASSICMMPSDKRHIQRLNDFAKKRGVPAKYEQVSKDEYWEYRNKIKAEIEGAKNA